MEFNNYVYEKLGEDGADFKNGQRENIVCPECSKAHVSVKPEKGWATCWTPGCDYRIRPRRNPRNGWVVAFMSILHDDWHEYLMSKGGKPVLEVLTEERQLDEGLIEYIPIGAVPPKYDLTRAIDAAKAAMLDGGSKSERDVPDDADGPASQSKRLEEWLNDPFRRGTSGRPLTLEQYIHSVGNWIARFYVDGNGNFISTNLRSPWEKKFGKIQPLPYMGVYRLLEPNDHRPVQFGRCPGDLLCFEGEANAEQFASECIRVAENTSSDEVIFLQKYIPDVCALGGVNAWDLETLSRMCTSPAICYDNDDGKGFKGVEAATAFTPKNGTKMKPVGFTTPTKDADDFFKQGGALQDFVARWESASRPTISYETVKATIDALRNPSEKEDRLPAFELNRKVAELVWDDLTTRGDFYHAGGLGMLFLRDSKKLIDISKDGHEFTNLMIRYGLHPTDKLKQHVGEYLGAQAVERGRAVTPHLFSFYDRARHAVYLSEYNGEVLRITPESIERVPNGTDGVLFKTTEHCQPFRVDLENLPTIKSAFWFDADTLVAKHITSQVRWDEGALTSEQFQTLFTAHMLTIFMKGVLRTRPLALLTGDSGSGKTMLAERVGWLLMGDGFNAVDMPDDKDDFEALVTGSPFVVIDNVHNLKKSSTHQSLLMITATGGSITKRELYSTNKQVTFPVQAMVYLSAIQSPFRGDEAANRLLLFRTLKYEQYRASARIKEDFMVNREAILGEVVVRIQKALANLRELKAFEPRTGFRMADFASYFIKVAVVDSLGNEALELLAAVSQSQSDYAVEDDVVIEQFSLWIGSTAKAGTRWWTASELDTALRDPVLKGGTLPWSPGDAKALSGYIRRNKDTFMKMFGMEFGDDSHLKIKKYRFNPTPERLHALQEEAISRMGGYRPPAPDDKYRWENLDAVNSVM